jgi:hypothetical protein
MCLDGLKNMYIHTNTHKHTQLYIRLPLLLHTHTCVSGYTCSTQHFSHFRSIFSFRLWKFRFSLFPTRSTVNTKTQAARCETVPPSLRYVKQLQPQLQPSHIHIHIHIHTPQSPLSQVTNFPNNLTKRHQPQHVASIQCNGQTDVAECNSFGS